jgi:hypothetical protein
MAEIATRTRVSRLSAEAFSTDFAGSLRPASMARCTGSSGGFASYRRDPLLGTYREGGAGDHVRAVECVPWLAPHLGCWISDAACYNYLYEIKPPSSTCRRPPPQHAHCSPLRRIRSTVCSSVVHTRLTNPPQHRIARQGSIGRLPRSLRAGDASGDFLVPTLRSGGSMRRSASHTPDQHEEVGA